MNQGLPLGWANFHVKIKAWRPKESRGIFLQLNRHLQVNCTISKSRFNYVLSAKRSKLAVKGFLVAKGIGPSPETLTWLQEFCTARVE